MKLIILAALIMIFGLVLAKPIPKPQAQAGGGGAPPTQLLLNGMPKSGIVGLADNIGAGLANFGNGQGSAFDALVSGVFNAFGNLFSGIFGSGVINTGFLNYNNRPPADSGAVTTVKPAAAGAAPAPAEKK